MIRAGKLRETVTIMRAHEIRNDAGTKVTTWTAHATTRAELVETATVEIADGTGTAETETITFRLRKVAVSPADRVLHAGRQLDIKSVRETANGRGLELTCEAP